MAERTKPLQVGAEAPDFRLPAAQGGEVTLSQYREQRHVLLLLLIGMT